MSYRPPIPLFFFILRLLALLLLCTAAPASAKEANDTDALKEALDYFLRTQTQGLPGKVSYNISKLDPGTQLAPCSAFEPFLPPGSRLWGKSTVAVRCLGPSKWTIYVQVQISLLGEYLVSAHSLMAGKVLSAEDFSTRSGDLSLLASSTLTDPAQALGKILKNGLNAGQPLRADQLTAPWAIQQGQNVKLLSKGSGFSISNDGKALNNAAEGQIAQVRTNSGQTISGIARTGGTVEISY
jgi:flagella basal body P-ring formation protein FlgA